MGAVYLVWQPAIQLLFAIRRGLLVPDEEAYRAADPFAGDGETFDGAANNAREAAIVRRLLAARPLAVVVLGAAHDLSRHVWAVGDVELVRVTVEGMPE